MHLGAFMKYLPILVLSWLPIAGFASDYNSIPEQFFKQLQSDKPEKAIDYLYSTNEWVSLESDQVLNLKAQIAGLAGLIGNYVFHELILEEMVGTRYAHLIYLVGYERQPVRFELRMYKASKEWRFQGVSFDTNLTDQIGSLANMKLLK